MSHLLQFKMFKLKSKSHSSSSSSTLSSTLLSFIHLIFLLGGILVVGVNSQQHQQQYYGSPLKTSLETSMPTVTVRGFLNFRTTVDGTVIVFTPSPSNGGGSSSQSSTVAPSIQPTQPPSNIQDEIRPTRASSVSATYPTGLVTVLGGTVVNEGSTTIYETKVIGTYISGKYAQILSSTTKVKPNDEISSPTVRPTMTYTKPLVRATRVASAHHHHHHHNHHHHNQPQQQQHDNQNNNNQRNEEEHASNAITGTVKKVHPLRAKSMKLIESSKARHLNARLQLNPLKSRWAKLKDNGNNDNGNGDQSMDNGEQNNRPKVLRRLKLIGSKRFTLPPRQSPRVKMNRFKNKLPPTQAEEMQQYHDSKAKENQDKADDDHDNNDQDNDNTKQIIDEKTKEKILEGLTSTTPLPTNVEYHPNSNEDKPNGSDNEGKLQIDPSRVVKEVQTITSEVTQHVEGNHLQVKTLTLTTTIERTLHPTESIEFDTNLIQPTLDVSINNIEATSIPETPALVISRTYSVTERTMRTTVVPVFDGTATQSHTVTESFFIRKLITAYRTLPPGDMILIDSTSTSAFNPSDMNTMMVNGTNSDVVVDDLSMAEQQTIQPTAVDSNILPTEMPNILDDNLVHSGLPANQIEPSLTMGGNGMLQPFPTANNQLAQQFDLNNPLLLAAVLQNPQLAALYFGLQQMKQHATQYSTITKPTKVLQMETLYNTKMVSYYDGRQTRSRTILEPTATKEKFVDTFTTEVIPIVNNQYQMQQAQFQNMFAQQFGMMPANPAAAAIAAQAPQFQITPTLKPSTVLKTITTVTDHTMTKSKVYTLVYNAFSTRYRTITSTSVVPTTVTTVLTETMAPMLSSTMLPNFFG